MRADGRRPVAAYGRAMPTATTTDSVRPFDRLSRDDLAFAGGKGANLGELTRAGFPVPGGFVIGAPAYAAFCDAGGLRERIAARLADVDIADQSALQAACEAIQGDLRRHPLPAALGTAIRDAYAALDAHGPGTAVAVRSSATAEDTAAASFAGMNETCLNVRGSDALLDAVRRCWASLFSPRTVAYRQERGFGQADMDIAVVVQRQVSSTRAGVMFTIDPVTGREDRLMIEAALGLGESVVSGQVTPDRFVVDKATREVLVREIHQQERTIDSTPGGGTRSRELSADEGAAATLDDDALLALADLGVRIERHYGTPQDTEWAFDEAGDVWMLQSRPVTATGHASAPASAAGTASADGGAPLVTGRGAAPGVASGPVRVLATLADGTRFQDGEVLVARMTAPDWVPLMRRAAAIVTEAGGTTCHAAIVSRELGVPCVVGARTATSVLHDGQQVTVDAGSGQVTAGRATPPGAAPVASVQPSPVVAGPPSQAAAAPVTATRLLVNLSEPSQALAAAALPVDGVGLVRAELMVLEALDGAHPRTLLDAGRGDELVDRLAAGLTTFANAFGDRPITYRTIDFRSNEFRQLRGGERFEALEANPMIGYRGALRYLHEPDLLRCELDAIRRVRDAGAEQLHVMLPFVRTAGEVARIREQIRAAGLLDQRGFELWVMAEVPSVLFNLERLAALGVAGISIGSNDLTQLLLGADRDSELVAEVFDERDPAVVAYVRQLIGRARDLGLRTSICGQAPSAHPEYAAMLVEAGIDAISVSADVVDRTRRLIAAAEQRLLLDTARDAVASRQVRGTATR